MINKREEYLNWDSFFMALAFISSQRSKDPNTQVGCAIADNNNIVLSLGYNGLPRGCNDDEYPWNRDGENELNKKYYYIVHSEENAILNAKGKDLSNSKIYVMYFPCNECTKSIIQSGIKEIIYYYSYDYGNHKPEVEASKRMLDSSGVKYSQYQKNGEFLTLEYKNKSMKKIEL